MKKTVKKLLNNKTLSVMRGSLRGTRLKVNDLVSGSVFFQNYEPDKQKVLRFLLRPGNIFFDIGANVGLHCYFVTKNIPAVKVYAFEPLPANTAYMKEAIAVNAFQRIEIIEAAVGALTGESYFDINDSNFSGRLSKNPTALKVMLTTLDEFTRQRDIWPDVVKIDAEAAESEVLKGAVQLVNTRPPAFVIELHNPTQDKLVGEFLLKHNYILYRINKEPGATDRNILLSVANPKASWPDPDGVWGGIVAIHKDNKSIVVS